VAVIVHYCDGCGIRIEPDDISEGRAAILGDKAYCPDCSKKLAIPKKKPDKPAKRTPARKPTTRVGPVRKKTTTSSAKKSRREESDDEYDYESQRFAPAKKKSSLPVILGICGVIIVIIIIAVATGGSDKNTKNRQNPRQAYQPPKYGTNNNTTNKEPYRKIEEPPRTNTALKRYQGALEYGRLNPQNYAGMLERLESTLNEEDVDFSLIDRIERTVSEWNGRWDAAATKEWEKVSEAAKKLVEKNDYKGATRLYENFPKKYEKFYVEKSKEEIARLQRHVEAFEAFKGMESDIKAADRDFTVDQLEEAETLFWKMHAFGKKYEDVEELVIKLNITLKKLWAKIEALEEQKFGE
jgi:hypothetical protein